MEHGIIRITDRDYGPGKAMKWAVASFFPGLGLWKGKKLASLPVSNFRKKRKERKQEHNTWLHSQPTESRLLTGLVRSRPPP